MTCGENAVLVICTTDVCETGTVWTVRFGAVCVFVAGGGGVVTGSVVVVVPTVLIVVVAGDAVGVGFVVSGTREFRHPAPVRASPIEMMESACFVVISLM